ncbi:helix-turn-helix transcriptional regulator [Geomonas anaerohicana]|uniref:AlpA family phage regulatory protein n=1 Tax=Geomonas anaerohicana TaxID=2798583 RepID=A0ABS0YCB0_9BACT|nr:AlpA family phage regulatory protein [Geomonas anaerohicana]MBJ6749935.1 AlpA family phage regulatory protein [Geomonas anaerohicana]
MDNDKLIRRKQVLDLIGLSHSTQWRLERAGRFPARVRLSSGSVGWHLAEVEEWVRERERVSVASDITSLQGGEPGSVLPHRKG